MRMTVRQALKVRDRLYSGRKYRKPTIGRMRRRLSATPHDTDYGLWFNDMVAEIASNAPIEFAGLQFQAQMQSRKGLRG
jgi:hypothetical protein